MAKITRVFQRIFGQNANLSEVGVFGSLAAAAPTNSQDPATIMSLSEWLDGWAAAVLGDNSPCLEDMNGFFFVAAYQLAYLLQQGVAEWDASTTYYKGSLVSVYAAGSASCTLYFSIVDDNTNNAVTDGTRWRVQGGSSTFVNGTTTLNGSEDLVKCDPTSGGFTVTLPDATQFNGKRITIKNIVVSGSVVTFKAAAGQLVDFANIYPTTLASGDSVTVFSDHVQWWVI